MPTGAGRPVEKVLLQAVADAAAKLGAAAGERAAPRVAGISLVALGVGAHEGAALLVAAGALPAGALQTIATAGAGLLPLVLGAIRRVAGTRLLGIASALAGAADGRVGGELALAAAVFVGVVADGVVLEAAGGGVAAGVVATLGLAAAVAVLALFDDAVAADGLADGGDAAVVCEARGLDAVAQQGGADVADGAGREAGDALGGGGVHDVLLAGVAGGAAERTARLRVDRVGIGAGAGGAVVDGAVRVARLVGNDLPLGGGADDDVCAGDGLAGAAAVLLRALDAGLTQPGQADGGARVAGGEQGPV